MIARTIVALFLSVSVCLGVGAASESCTPAERQFIQKIEPAILTVEQMACVVAKIELGQEEPQILQMACDVRPEQWQSLINTITSVKQGKAQAARILAAFERDAGRDAK